MFLSGRRRQTADFSGVALMPTMTDKPPGTYKVALYSDDKMLAQEGFIVTQDLSAKNAEAASAAAEAAAAKEAQRKRDEEARKLAMIDERRAKPLQLRSIDFLNTTKTGTALSRRDQLFRGIEGAVRRLGGQLREPALQAGAQPVPRRCGVYRARRPHAGQRQRLSVRSRPV